MITDIELKNKFEILSKKLQHGLNEEVIREAHVLLKKRKHGVLFNIISIANQNLGKYEESIKIMEIALGANPNNPNFLNNIGISYHKLDEYEKGKYYLIRGLEIEPNHLHILNNLGNLYKDLNFTDNAISYYKKTLSINKKLLQPLFNLAICYETIGKFEEAKLCVEEILEYHPNFTEADRLLASKIKYKEGNKHFHSMSKKLKDDSLNKFQKSHLHFGIAKYYEDIRNYKNSFIHYTKGNDIQKEHYKYEITRDKNEFDKIKKFDYKKLPQNKEKNRQLIFIVGMPRSGTSLVEQILSSHNNVIGGGELSFLEKIIKKNFLKNEKIDRNKIDEIVKKSQQEYYEKISNFDKSDKTFTDKAPLNFRYIGFIKKIFPNAKIISCRRNPLNIGWSIFKNFFSGSLLFSCNLKDIGEFYKLYEELMKFWMSDHSELIYDINYEELVQNPEIEIKKILNFCELDWDPNCLNHHQNKRSIKTASSSQARKPIYNSSIKSTENFIEFLGDLKKSLNIN